MPPAVSDAPDAPGAPDWADVPPAPDAPDAPEWGPGDVTFSVEEDVVFTTDGCRLIDGRQTEFALI